MQKRKFICVSLIFMMALTMFVVPAYSQDAQNVQETQDAQDSQNVQETQDVQESQEQDDDLSYVVSHRYTGAPVTAIPEELKTVDTRGGEIVEIPGLDFSKPNPEITVNYGVMDYVPLDGGGGYHKARLQEGTTSHKLAVLSKNMAPAKINRNYLCSALVWLDFDRINEVTDFTVETILYVRFMDKDGNNSHIRRCGTTDFTNGWQRIEYVASSLTYENVVGIQFAWSIQRLEQGNPCPIGNFCIADFTVVELPREKLVPYAEGEGVTFKGGAGDLDMRVEGANETDENIKVTTTGAVYTFDRVNDKIIAEQRIAKKRVVSEWQSSVDFSDLSIKKTTEKECVISNKYITIGVQLDSSVFITPHVGDAVLTCTSKISGIWNRIGKGCLFVLDDYGGFSVCPDIPSGTGRLNRYKVITEDLDFAKYKYMNFRNNVSEDQLIYHSAVSNAKPGWQIAWMISPGERLAIGVMPPREYDWKASFDLTYTNSQRAQKASQYANYPSTYGIGLVNMFNFSDVGYAMEWQPHYVQVVHKDTFESHLKAIKDAGMKVMLYTSSYYYYKWDADAYIAEIKRLKEKWNIDGVYTDGQPNEWIVAYEQTRMLRELFPDGTIMAHATDMAPAGSASIFFPGSTTYFTATLKAEGISGIGLDWTYPRTGIMTQYNGSNCIGVGKYEHWQDYDEEGNLVKLPQLVRWLAPLEYNGRSRMDKRNAEWTDGYVPVLRALRKVWEEYGDEEDFYERYYAPAARELTKDVLSQYCGDLKVLDEDFSDEEKVNAPSGYAFYNTKAEVSEIDGGKALRLTGASKDDKGSMFKRVLSVSGPLSIEYKIKVTERGDFEQTFSDNYGNPGIGLRFGIDGKVKVRNVAGEYVNIADYERDVWYTVKFEIDTDKKSYDIYLDGKKIRENAALHDKVYRISDLEFFDGGYGSVCYIDDLKVMDKY
ncbi:MAG: hypothetical protein II997_02035 [Clostridia bacterium]|nr:hypothetical protein [Clostridia bacterium]